MSAGPSRRGLAWGALALGLLALAGLAAWFGLVHAPRAAVEGAVDGALCARCHDSVGFAGEAHGGVDCRRCHGVDDAHATSLYWAGAGIQDAPRGHGEVGPGVCAACHASGAGEPLASEGHRAHGDGGLACASCHADLHGGEPPRVCEGCHSDVERHGPTATLACTTCHVFRGEGEPGTLVDSSREQAGVAGGSGLDASRVHGAMDCRSCHDPHREGPAEVRCEECHRGHIAEELAEGPRGHLGVVAGPLGEGGEAEPPGCTGCHQPHAVRDDPSIDCLGCHAYPDPAEGHAWGTPEGGVTPAARAATEGRVSHDGRCSGCHVAHTMRASTTTCGQCHEAPAAGLRALPEGTHEGCESCHQPHEAAPTAAVCASCHGQTHAPSAAAPAAHRDCLSCHDPHAGRPRPAETCASCHGAVHREALTSAAPHRRCTSCHAAHGAPLGPTADSCGRCHQEPRAVFARAAPAAPAAHACASCHRPHAFDASRAVTACASCHGAQSGPGASHRDPCTSCHEGHGAPMGRAPRCAGCHRGVRPSVEAHARCAGCHEPHRPGVAAGRECAGCHAGPARSTRGWPQGSPHAGRCLECHQTHDEARWTGCGTCHREQSNRAHTGGHPSCVQCHAPHVVAPAGADGWWSRCGSCHAAEAQAARGAQGTHARCAACHETPGPPLPTCAGCHDQASRPLAHRTHAAQACTSCHATHGQVAIGRERCLGCHEDRIAHFADAPRCQSCHPFAR